MNEYNYTKNECGGILSAKMRYIVMPRYRRMKYAEIIKEYDVGTNHPKPFLVENWTWTDFHPPFPEGMEEIACNKICYEYYYVNRSHLKPGPTHYFNIGNAQELPTSFGHLYFFPHTCIKGIDPGSIEIWALEVIISPDNTLRETYTLYSFMPQYELVKSIYVVEFDNKKCRRNEFCNEDTYSAISFEEDDCGYTSDEATIYSRALSIFNNKYS